MVPPTPTTTMATITPPPTRIRTAIPSYQNYTISTPSAAAGVGSGYSVFQPAGWAQSVNPNRPRSAPDARTTQPMTWISPAETKPPSYPSLYSTQIPVTALAPPSQYTLSTPPAQYAPTPPAATISVGTDGESTSGGGGTAPSWRITSGGGGGAPTQGLAPVPGAPTPGGPPLSNHAGYGSPQAPLPYGYGNTYGRAPGQRHFGMPSTIRNAIRMIQPFYSDSASVDKARTFWNAFVRATEGLDDALRLSAFRECLKGKAGEQWWMYSRIDTFETLRTRFHNQFICQTLSR
ncbi:unnamed protein product [Phytophthora fragariaefolia]|uniref:Unnamed protein product n=1 Tax=Phytophthora fragariaefolia TaxID=1490495 RepID=A0A9W7CN34_9STRA|nr:unnamed protein product [Phytophthora fragariaefolia]